MSHRYAIVNAYRVELKRNTPSLSYGIFDRCTKSLEMDVSRDYIDVAIANRYKRFRHIIVRYSCSLQERTVRRTLETLLYSIRPHLLNSTRNGLSTQKKSPQSLWGPCSFSGLAGYALARA